MVWLGTLYSHTFLYNCILNMLFCSLALTKYFPCFLNLTLRRSNTLWHFHPSFLLLLLLLLPLVTFLPASPSSVLLPRSPSHRLLSLSLNDLIPPMPLHLHSSRMIVFSQWKLPAGCGCDSSDSCWCQHELASCVAMWQCEIGYFNAQRKENSSNLSGFSWCILRNVIELQPHIPLVDLNP